ncbi:MAG: amidohydrolase family protein [Planctomycetes bacterium]|nr:amidohydrolase family protein [Planctomycetota bacterium]
MKFGRTRTLATGRRSLRFAFFVGACMATVAVGFAQTEQAPRAGEKAAPTGLALKARKALVVGAEGESFVDNALVLVKDGKIESVGPARTTVIPPGYEVIDCGTRWIAPGFVDLHCHIAAGSLGDLNDTVYMTNPELHASAAVTPNLPALKLAVAGGVTTVLFIPGSGSNMGGQGILLKTGFTKFEDMRIRDPGSLKLAQAGNPERWAIGVGRSHMNWNTRNTFERGLAYATMWERFEQGLGPKPERNIQWDIFRWLKAKKTQVSTHTQRYQVVLATLTMVRVGFGLDVYIDHGEWFGSKLAAYAEEIGVNAIIGPREVDVPSFSLDTDGAILGIAASYQKNGHTKIGFNTDSPVVPQEELSVQAAVAVRYGFDDSRQDSMRGLTYVPALTAGIAHRVGSLAPGKDADLIVTTGDPLDPRSSVEIVFIEGRRVYDAAVEKRRW